MQKRMGENGENRERGSRGPVVPGSEAGNQRQRCLAVPCGASAGPTGEQEKDVANESQPGALQAIVKSVLRISRHRMRM